MQQQGFTIIELLVVMLIIAILAAAPLFNWPGTVINLDAQADLLANDIRYTQSQSMAKAERYRLVSLSATSYQIQNSAGSPLLFPAGNTTMNLNAGFSFSSWGNLTNNVIVFDGRGTPYLDSSLPGTPLTFGTAYNITITGGGNNKIVNISPITGRVSTS